MISVLVREADSHSLCVVSVDAIIYDEDTFILSFLSSGSANFYIPGLAKSYAEGRIKDAFRYGSLDMSSEYCIFLYK